jgi:hypothetical protein
MSDCTLPIVWIILTMLNGYGFNEMQVRLVFDEPESGVTIIKLKQTDVPEEDKYVHIQYSVSIMLFLHFVCNFKSAEICVSHTKKWYATVRYGNSTVVENTERGWRELIFQRIRGGFGFGV